MTSAPLKTPAAHPPGKASFSFLALLSLAFAFGLCGGYLDLVIIVLKKLFVNEEGYYRNAADFPWTVPLSHACSRLDAVGCGRRAQPASARTNLAPSGIMAGGNACHLGGFAEAAPL